MATRGGCVVEYDGGVREREGEGRRDRLEEEEDGDDLDEDDDDDAQRPPRCPGVLRST